MQDPWILFLQTKLSMHSLTQHTKIPFEVHYAPATTYNTEAMLRFPTLAPTEYQCTLNILQKWNRYRWFLKGPRCCEQNWLYKRTKTRLYKSVKSRRNFHTWKFTHVRNAEAVILFYTQNKKCRSAAIFCVEGSWERLIEFTSENFGRNPYNLATTRFWKPERIFPIAGYSISENQISKAYRNPKSI